MELKENKEIMDGCCREKYWSELPIEDKLERARKIVNGQQESIDYLAGCITTLENRFRLHIHNDKDNLIYYKEEYRDGIGLGVKIRRPENPNEDYF